MANPMSTAETISRWVTDRAAIRRVVDGLQNLMTGFGTARDKSTYARYADAPLLSVWDIETLLKDSPLARKVVTKIPQDALRGGFSVKRKGKNDSEYVEEARLLAERCNELQVTESLYRAAWLSRAFGGAGVVLSLLGAGGPSTELDDEDVGEAGLLALRSCDRQDFNPAHWRPDGSTDVWWWQPVSPGGGPQALQMTRLHTSRVVWFRGADTTDRARVRNQYWDLSVLQALFQTLVSYDGYWASLDAQVSDASQAVTHIQGFIEALASNTGDVAAALQKRFALMDMSRSNAKMLVLDAGDKDGNGREDFEVVERASLASMDKLTSVYLNRFAADAGYPVSVLFEQAAAGTNATGESDLTLHYNNVSAYQAAHLMRPATRLVRLVARDLGLADPDEWEVCFPQLYVPKPLDVASAEKMRVDSTIGLVTAGIIVEEEAALSLHEVAPSLRLAVDRTARERALKDALKEVADRTINEEPAPVAPAGTPGQASKASGRKTKAQPQKKPLGG
jgi:hypothetical protein